MIPADGTAGVPLNANVWIFGEEQNAYVLVDGAVERRLGHSYWSSRIQKLDLGPLSANRTYTVKTSTGERVTTFTSGTDVDSTPPGPPTIESVRYEAGQLSISATSNGSVAVWVTTQRNLKRGLWAWQLFPSEGFTTAFDTCNQFDADRGGDNCVELSSMDLAGNQSKFVSNCTPIIGASRFPLFLHATEAERDVKRELILIGLGVFAGLGLIGVQRRLATRRLHVATTAPLARADVITGARELRRRMTLLALGCFGAFAFGWMIPAATLDKWLSAVVPLIALALFAAAKALRAHRALALLSAAESETTTDGHHFVFLVLDGKLQTFLELSRAGRSDLPLTQIPTATVRINDGRSSK